MPTKAGNNQRKKNIKVKKRQPKTSTTVKSQRASVDLNKSIKKIHGQSSLKPEEHDGITLAKAYASIEELDRIAKMLVRRDLALSEMREKREKELQELGRRTEELEGGRKALMNILEDVDEERKKAETERDKTTIILRNFVDGLLLIENKKVSFLNVKAREFFGLVEGEGVVGKSIAELRAHPKLGLLVDVLKKEKMAPNRAVLKMSDKLVLNVSAVPMTDVGNEDGVMIILHDITRERVIERMKTEFVSIAAHQLRTPLSAVKWILRMILDGDLGEVPEAQAEFLEKTYQSNERMIKLVNDLLNVTRIEEGRFLNSVKSEDIVKIIENTIAPLREVAERKKLKFEYKKPKDAIPKIKVDSERITLAVQNLVDNAIRYTRNGSIKVAVEFQKGKNIVLFSVTDTGIGVPKNQQDRVFDRFFRASTAVKTETEGTGLGLFIAKNIIEAHGGKIWFETEENKGSTFYISLPVGKQEEFTKFIEGF